MASSSLATRYAGKTLIYFFLSATSASAETNLNMENGLQFFSADRQHKFHPGSYLLFSDVVMPGNVNGYVLADRRSKRIQN